MYDLFKKKQQQKKQTNKKKNKNKNKKNNKKTPYLELRLRDIHLDHAKRKCVFEHAQNAQIQI